MASTPIPRTGMDSSSHVLADDRCPAVGKIVSTTRTAARSSPGTSKSTGSAECANAMNQPGSCPEDRRDMEDKTLSYGSAEVVQAGGEGSTRVKQLATPDSTWRD